MGMPGVPRAAGVRDGFPTSHRNRQSVVGGHSPRTCRTPVAQAPSQVSHLLRTRNQRNHLCFSLELRLDSHPFPPARPNPLRLVHQPEPVGRTPVALPLDMDAYCPMILLTSSPPD